MMTLASHLTHFTNAAAHFTGTAKTPVVNEATETDLTAVASLLAAAAAHSSDAYDASSSFPKPPEKSVQMKKQMARSWPSIAFNSGLMLSLGLIKTLSGILTIPGIYLSFAAVSHGIRSLGNDWAKPFIPAAPNKEKAIERLVKCNYAYPRAQYNLKLLHAYKEKNPLAGTPEVKAAIALKASLNQQAITFIDKYIDPKKPTHLIITRKQLEKKLGVSCETAFAQNWLNKSLYPLDWVYDKVAGGGKASLEQLAIGLENKEREATSTNKQLEHSLQVLERSLQLQHQRSLFNTLKWDENKALLAE